MCVAAYRWETPVITRATARRPFEFVLINSPQFCDRKSDAITYTQYFTDDDTDSGVIAFENLSGDALLRALAETIQYPDVDALVRHGSEALEEMRQLDIITGARPVQ